ncbi:MAG: hypothetical protein AABX59_00130, partial [Nanoarchaeota archaeon]
GEECSRLRLSGRDVKNISRELLERIYDAEEPEEVFSLTPAEQVQLLRSIYNPISANLFLKEIVEYRERIKV